MLEASLLREAVDGTISMWEEENGTPVTLPALIQILHNVVPPPSRCTLKPNTTHHLIKAVRRHNRAIRAARRLRDNLLVSRLTYARLKLIKELRAQDKIKQFRRNKSNFHTDRYLSRTRCWPCWLPSRRRGVPPPPRIHTVRPHNRLKPFLPQLRPEGENRNARTQYHSRSD